MMLDKFKTAIDFIKNNNDADDFTINLHSEDVLETRFAQNRITQNMSGAKFTISTTLIYGKKKGSVSIEQLDQDYIKNRLALAKTIAMNSVDDPELLATEAAKEVPTYINFDQAVADIDIEDTAAIVKRCIDNAQEHDAMISGMLTRESFLSILTTKNGFYAEDKGTYFEHSMTMKKDAKETRVSKSVIRKELYDLEALIASLNSQFNSLNNPEEMAPKKIAVILRPQAVIDLYSFMSWFMDRRTADLGMTPFSGKLGEDFFGSNFNMYSTTADDRVFRTPFTNDGMINKDIDWVKDGKLMNLTTSRFYAQDKDIPVVNHPFNVIIKGGDKTEEEMMQMVDEGLIINRFWYIRVIDGKSGELTGLTRDGVLYFKDGKVQKSVNNFRWNEIPHETTRRILALGKQDPIAAWTAIPTMLIDNFTFVDNTRF
jgi:predicted Zn-dependent protease